VWWFGHRDREVDVDLVLLNHHPLDHRADEVLPFLKGQRGQGPGDAAGKAFHAQL
jgi:hypothetical protein